MTCIFCEIVAGRAPASLVHEDERFVAFMDIYPVRPAHLLVIPRRHAPRLGDLAGDETAALFALTARLAAAVRTSGLPCDDVNVVCNDGPAANQTVPHTHVHVVPRRRGDLPALARQLLQRPVQALLGGPPRPRLEAEAAAIRAALASSPPPPPRHPS